MNITVKFYSSTTKETTTFRNQAQFSNFIWKNFKKGDEVYSEAGNVIGRFKMMTENAVFLTD